MIHELREYQFRPGCWADYRRLFLTVCMPVRGNDHGRLVGAWHTPDDGATVTFFSVWAYDSLDARAALRVRLAAMPQWQQFLASVRGLLDRQHLGVLHPQGPGDVAAGAYGGLYLNRYRCTVGHAPAVAASRRDADLACWTTEFPDPNQVVCLSRTDAAGASVDSASVQAADSRRVLPLQLAEPFSLT